MDHLNITDQDALILIDIQNDFMPGGSLAVPDGDAILPIVEDLAEKFDNIILTQDWHPAGHSSFASSHDGKSPFEMTDMAYGAQVLWPDHCVQGTPGAEFRLPEWIQQKSQLIIRKGYRAGIDSYSAFLENDQTTPTGLMGYLQERGLKRLFFVGLATDFCVGFSAIDAVNMGFEATVVTDACRGIASDSIQERTAQMVSLGVNIV